MKNSQPVGKILVALLFLLVGTIPNFARAACSNPSMPDGAVFYNAAQHVPQLCAGTTWVALGALNPGAGSGSCSSPSMPGGSIFYNDDYGVLQYCDGANWIAVQTAASGSGSGSVTSNVSILDAGNRSACLIKTNGTLWCWGDNSEGQLGQGGAADLHSAVPLQVGSNTDWVDITAGGEGMACGIRDSSSNRTLWCWGSRQHGALADGIDDANQETDTPAQVGSATNWRQVSCGGGYGERKFCCATRNDNTLWCWGGDNVGQTAQGASGTNLTAVTQVGALTTWSKVSAGRRHACAIKTDGTVWCWGEAGNGQMGNNSTTDRSTPVQDVPFRPHAPRRHRSLSRTKSCAAR